MNDPILKIQVADTPSKQAKGLMFVRKMPFNEGMLFSFDKPQKLSFWGQNTFIPLDIAFADKNGIIRDIATIEPHSLRPVKSSENCQYAIEANIGFFQNHGVKIGDMVVQKGDDSLVFRRKRRTTAAIRELGKESQLMGNEYGFDVQDAQKDAEEAARSRYESLPTVSPDRVGDILVDQEFEDSPQQIVDQPSDLPEPTVPEVDLQPVDVTEPSPEFENVFDAVDEYAKPTIDNMFKGQAMRIEYTTKSGISIARDIEPHGTFHADSTGNEILVTYDRTAGGIRAYIMQNIRAFAFLSDEFEPKFKVKQ